MLPNHFFSKAYQLGKLAFSGHSRVAWQAFSLRVHSDTVFFGLRRDLSIPFTPAPARIPIQVRPLRADDDISMLERKDCDAQEMLIRLGQLRLLRLNLPTCYVAVDASGQVTYMQWLISSSQNLRIRQDFGDIYPELGPHDALLEGAYTMPEFRGKGIMACAMAQIAAKAQKFGARNVLTFVEENNIPSLKGCEKAGFSPYLVRRGQWRMLQRKISFEYLQADQPLAPREARVA